MDFEGLVVPVVEVQIPNEDLLGKLAGVIADRPTTVRDG